MAEAFVNQLAGDRFLAESAGLESGQLDPLVVKAMSEIGIDISRNQTKSVVDMLQQNKRYDYVVTVCDEASAERCPIFSGQGHRLHWGFPDPSDLSGSPQEQMVTVRHIRDEIKQKIKSWITLPAKS